MQDRFPGIGNWMADEILWHAARGERAFPPVRSGRRKYGHCIANAVSSAG
ncbi:MAG: hypothetical protein PHQ04_08365 [Opitutaceae bacterium]|nr:hypothetical protein [Opitutaceae bacterium]